MSSGDIEKEHINRRQVERKYLVFYLRVFDGMSSNVIGHVVNISAKGVLLLSDNPVPVNEEYRLRMRLPSEITDRGEILFNATSRWSKKDANPDFYLTGYKIQNLSSSIKNNILCLIDDFSFVD